MKSESQKIGNNRCCPKATVAAICSVALLAASVVVCRCARKDVGRVAQSGRSETKWRAKGASPTTPHAGASPHEASAIHLPVRLPPVVLGEEAKRALSERVWNDEAANARFASELCRPAHRSLCAGFEPPRRIRCRVCRIPKTPVGVL